MNTFEDELNKAADLAEQGKRQEAIAAYKQLLVREDARIEDRMMTHINLAYTLSRGVLQDPDVKAILTQEEIDECATNCSFAKHLYNHFLKDPSSKMELKQFNDSAGATLTHCVFRLGAAVHNFSGRWRTEKSICEDFRRFKGYPTSYYEEVPEPSSSETSKPKGGCFIATAAYGSELATEVILFRHFRDTVLQSYTPTRHFIKLYYKFSPSIADFISTSVTRKFLVRSVFLKPLFHLLKLWLMIGERE